MLFSHSEGLFFIAVKKKIALDFLLQTEVYFQKC